MSSIAFFTSSDMLSSLASSDFANICSHSRAISTIRYRPTGKSNNILSKGFFDSSTEESSLIVSLSSHDLLHVAVRQMRQFSVFRGKDRLKFSHCGRNTVIDNEVL